MIQAFLQTVGGGLLALLPIINPLAAVPLFLSMTAGDTDEHRTGQARRAGYYMVFILGLFLYAGPMIFSFFGLSLQALRIAGGLLVLNAGWNQLGSESPLQEKITEAAQRKRDISFSPLAMPLLSGPGSIAVTMSMAVSLTAPVEYAGLTVAIVISALLSYLTLRAAPAVADYIGQVGQEVINRLMGFITICIGVQFVLTGIKAAFFDH